MNTPHRLVQVGEQRGAVVVVVVLVVAVGEEHDAVDPLRVVRARVIVSNASRVAA